MNTIALICLALTFLVPQDASREKLGTAVEWEETVDLARSKARKEDKLVLVLHVAGHFERAALT